MSALSTVVFVPSAPLLLFGGGPPELQAALAQALAALTGEIVVVGAAPTAGVVEGTVDLTPYGVPGVPSADPLPLALAVGRTLLGARPHRLWGVPSPTGPLPADSLLVVADGSATRSEKAPAYFDPRAATFDGLIAQALQAGSPEQLAGLDPLRAAELGAAGLPAWAAAGAVAGPWQAELIYDQAPYGVGYFVAVWRR